MKTCSCNSRERFPAKARFTENSYEHIVSFMPGFKCERFIADRNDPGNHGVTSAEIIFLVQNALGAVQFQILSGWYPDWRKDKFGALPADLGYHSPTPRYEGQAVTPGDCRWLGKNCYYDGSTLNAEEPFDILIMKGESALWKYLEDYHREIFS